MISLNIWSHDMLESFMLQLNTWHTWCGSTWQIQEVQRYRVAPITTNKKALRQHIYQAFYQAGYLSRQSVELDITDPEQLGWKKYSNGYFQPLWTTSRSSVAVKNFTETCSCKTIKCKSCKCARAMPIHLRMRWRLYVSELYITVALNFCFCRQTERHAFFYIYIQQLFHIYIQQLFHIYIQQLFHIYIQQPFHIYIQQLFHIYIQQVFHIYIQQVFHIYIQQL